MLSCFIPHKLRGGVATRVCDCFLGGKSQISVCVLIDI